MKNKIFVIAGLFVFLIIGMAAGKSGKQKHENLKILPKDISDSDLDSVMSGFVNALNVDCNFCHARSKTNAAELDFASDDIPEKEITRIMMKMTEGINKDYFNYTVLYKPNERMAVSCITCHNGYPRPELRFEKKE